MSGIAGTRCSSHHLPKLWGRFAQTTDPLVCATTLPSEFPHFDIGNLHSALMILKRGTKELIVNGLSRHFATKDV